MEDVGSSCHEKSTTFHVAGAKGRVVEKSCTHAPAAAGDFQEQVFTLPRLGLILFCSL